MKCAVEGCPEKSNCDHCHKCQYHHDEELGQLNEGDINPMKKVSKKRITDEQGIVYEEVSYQTYLTSKNKHRIVKSLESQYFVEVSDLLSEQGVTEN